MRVKDLIADSIWLPGSTYGKKPAELSVTLPTFRRLASGLFERCVDSILAQDFKDLELIIIDDGSTDGTFDRIQKYMEVDGRVSCIRHPRNVGLPAVSEYEAYCRATAPYIGYAFDDCALEPDAYGRLLRKARHGPPRAVIGYCSIDQEGQRIFFGRSITPAKLEVLRVCNFLPNCGLLLHRNVLETVGHYDPHVTLIRLCDWDLLRRIHAQGLLDCVDVYAAYEGGGVAEGTLARSFQMDMLAVYAHCGKNRNEALSTDNLPEYDVLARPEGCDREALEVFARMARRNFQQRFWYAPVIQDGYVFSDRGAGLHVCPIGRHLSTYLPFDGLPEEAAGLVLHTHSGECAPHPDLFACCAYAIMSHATSDTTTANIVRMLRAMGVPMYYHDADEELLRHLLDENTPETTLHSIRSTLSLFAGIIVDTQARADVYAKKSMHDTVLLLPPVYRSDLALPEENALAAPDSLSLALLDCSEAGQDLFLRNVYPALRRLAKKVRLRLFLPEELHDRLSRFLKEIALTPFAKFPSYAAAVRTLASFSPDIALNMEPGGKDGFVRPPLALMTASLAGAALLTGRNAPYSTLPESLLAFADDTPEGWQSALEWLAGAPEECKRKSEAAAIWCEEHFGAGHNLCVLRELSGKHPAPDALEMRFRVRNLLKAH